jgi:hypothetical protein
VYLFCGILQGVLLFIFAWRQKSSSLPGMLSPVAARAAGQETGAHIPSFSLDLYLGRHSLLYSGVVHLAQVLGPI